MGTLANFVGGAAVGWFAGAWVGTQAGIRNKSMNNKRNVPAVVIVLLLLCNESNVIEHFRPRGFLQANYTANGEKDKTGALCAPWATTRVAPTK